LDRIVAPGEAPFATGLVGESNQADRIALSFGGLSDLQRKMSQRQRAHGAGQQRAQ